MPARAWLDGIKSRAKRLEEDTRALWFAYRHPRTPWYAKLLAIAVVGYALSPVDLIPDFIPVLGALDDLVIVPGGVWLVVRLIPPDVMRECRLRAHEAQLGHVGTRVIGLLIVAAFWLVALVVIGIVVARLVHGRP